MTASAARHKASLIGGTFLICFSLLAFEVSTVRTINFVIGPSFIFLAIALAMLGLTSAGSILSTINLDSIKPRREYIFFSACLAISALLLLSNLLVVESKNALNTAVETAGRAGGMAHLLPALTAQSLINALNIGLFLCLPYFLFGALLSYLFASSSSEDYARLYASDMIGAAIGCVAIIGAMEATSYAFSVTVPSIVAAVAAGIYILPLRRTLSAIAIGVAVILSLLPQSASFRAHVEPLADPNYLVRDYNYRSKVAETWSRWNSFTRVGTVEWTDGSSDHATLALANGDGMAFLYPYFRNRAKPLVHEPTVPAVLLGSANDALVMFAGAGADLMSLKEQGDKRVTGVELNPTIIEAGRALGRYHLMRS